METFIFYSILYKKSVLEVFLLDNMDINKILAEISKMDKVELEKNLQKAKQILEQSNLKKDNK